MRCLLGHRGGLRSTTNRTSAGPGLCLPIIGTGRLSRYCVPAAAALSEAPPLADLDDTYDKRHSFSPYANWIIPGHVMLGRYPFIEPSRCTSRDQGEEQLTAILKAGVTTFVCLQDEVPPQAEMKMYGWKGFLPYKTTAELIASSLNGPPPREVVDGLRNPYLDRYLPPRKTEPGNSWTVPDLAFLHFPVVDLGVPDQLKLVELVKDIRDRMMGGEVLYVHCWGGRGRAGTVGAVQLAAMYGVSGDEALARVQRAFDTRHDNGRPSPETREQQQLVRDVIATHFAS